MIYSECFNPKLGAPKILYFIEKHVDSDDLNLRSWRLCAATATLLLLKQSADFTTYCSKNYPKWSSIVFINSRISVSRVKTSASRHQIKIDQRPNLLCSIMSINDFSARKL